MYYIYILKSEIDERLYVGYTSDLRSRFKRHNRGLVKSIKGFRPWKLVYYEAYSEKKDATKREYQIKRNHAIKEEIKSRLVNSLNI